MASTKTPTSTSNGTGGPGGRLPSTRERRPALAALAVLLILGGALASAWLAVRSGHRAEYLQVNANVGQGAQISDSDLRTVELPEDFDGGIPADDRDEIVGDVAATPLSEGTVLMGSMVSSEEDFDASIVQLALPVGDLASDLDAGTSVVVYTGGSAKPIAATVASEPDSSDASTGSTTDATATISLPVSCGQEVVQADTNDQARVGKVAATGSDDVRTGC